MELKLNPKTVRNNQIWKILILTKFKYVNIAPARISWGPFFSH